jgi:hypothetical protein
MDANYIFSGNKGENTCKGQHTYIEPKHYKESGSYARNAHTGNERNYTQMLARRPQDERMIESDLPPLCIVARLAADSRHKGDEQPHRVPGASRGTPAESTGRRLTSDGLSYWHAVSRAFEQDGTPVRWGAEEGLGGMPIRQDGEPKVHRLSHYITKGITIH